MAHKTDLSIQQDDSSPTSQLYRHSYFSKEGITARKALVPTLILPIIYNAVLLWACFSLFFGSLLWSNDISKISVTVVNLDDGALGTGLINRVKGSLNKPGPKFQWHFDDVSTRHSDAWSIQRVLDEKSWAVLQISANASSMLSDALLQGDSKYDPLSAATLYFASARNQVTTLAVTLPAVMGLISPILAELTGASTSTFLQSTARNSSLLTTALQCPQCLTSPFAVKQVDLIPFSPAVAFGTLNTGLIFLLTFTFNIFTILRAGAEQHGHLFTLRSHLFFRTLSSLSAYLFLSLMYTLGILAFSVPLTGHYDTTGAGFMVLWMLNWCTMGACGLVLESVFTVVGMQWSAFALNIWLIVNATGGFASFETMVGFYEYGYMMPFYHTIQATRTVVFGTKSHLRLNFGILIVWVLIGWSGMCLGMAWRVRAGKRTGVHMMP